VVVAGGGTATAAAAAQLRLMIPVAVVAGFLNNAPIVTVMIPIVQRWAQQIQVPVQQLLIPLSLAAILGGTCTLIGSSTNLVVVGLLDHRYPNDPEIDIGMFDLGKFGVPVAMVGCEYLPTTPTVDSYVSAQHMI
jgi:Na+/H+ antiporter NhaD/arsenite permease-like protein